jgi:hypothetical protein
VEVSSELSESFFALTKQKSYPFYDYAVWFFPVVKDKLSRDVKKNNKMSHMIRSWQKLKYMTDR